MTAEANPNKLGEAQTKLVAALQEAKAPAWMLDRALDGCYDDYKSEFATPIRALVQDARRFGLVQIAERAIDGQFDGTKADSDAWAAQARQDPDGAAVRRRDGDAEEAPQEVSGEVRQQRLRPDPGSGRGPRIVADAQTPDGGQHERSTPGGGLRKLEDQVAALGDAADAERRPQGEGPQLEDGQGRDREEAAGRLREPGDGLPARPPGPGDREAWARIVELRPDLAPAVEPAVLRVADGTANRIDRLRLTGNGVDPMVAAAAFSALWHRFNA